MQSIKGKRRDGPSLSVHTVPRCGERCGFVKPLSHLYPSAHLANNVSGHSWWLCPTPNSIKNFVILPRCYTSTSLLFNVISCFSLAFHISFSLSGRYQAEACGERQSWTLSDITSLTGVRARQYSTNETVAETGAHNVHLDRSEAKRAIVVLTPRRSRRRRQGWKISHNYRFDRILPSSIAISPPPLSDDYQRYDTLSVVQDQQPGLMLITFLGKVSTKIARGFTSHRQAARTEFCLGPFLQWGAVSTISKNKLYLIHPLRHHFISTTVPWFIDLTVSLSLHNL